MFLFPTTSKEPKQLSVLSFFLCRFFVFFNWAYNWYSLFVCVYMYMCVSLCICVCVCGGVIKIFKYIYNYILCMYNTPTFILKLNLSCLIVCLSVSLVFCLFLSVLLLSLFCSSLYKNLLRLKRLNYTLIRSIQYIQTLFTFVLAWSLLFICFVLYVFWLL